MTDIVVRVSAEVLERLQAIADGKGVELERVLADALGLEMTYAQIKSDGGRLLVEKAGHVEELTPA